MQRVNPVPGGKQGLTSGDRKRNATGGWSNTNWLLSAGALALLVVSSRPRGCILAVGNRGAQFPPRTTCKVDRPVARGTDAIINMTVRSAGACTVVIRSAAPVASTLELQTPPKNGALRRRGNTGVIYRVGRDFKGRDSFSFSIATRASGHSDATTCHVDVNVL
jgi:hypothetical protein